MFRTSALYYNVVVEIGASEAAVERKSGYESVLMLLHTKYFVCLRLKHAFGQSVRRPNLIEKRLEDVIERQDCIPYRLTFRLTETFGGSGRVCPCGMWSMHVVP